MAITNLGIEAPQLGTQVIPPEAIIGEEFANSLGILRVQMANGIAVTNPGAYTYTVDRFVTAMQGLFFGGDTPRLTSVDTAATFLADQMAIVTGVNADNPAARSVDAATIAGQLGEQIATGTESPFERQQALQEASGLMVRQLLSTRVSIPEQATTDVIEAILEESEA